MRDQHNPIKNSNSGSSSPAVISKSIVLFTVAFTLFFTSYMYSSVNIALPDISKEFNAHVIDLSWVTLAILVTSSIFLIPFGRLADIIGLKKMIVYGVILYITTNAITALSDSVTMLIVMRAIQGISAAMIVGNTIALISSTFPAGERGKALGITSSAVYIGLACGPLISGFLTDQFGWRSIFLINVPAGLIILFLIFWNIKGEWRGSNGESLDLIGTALFGIAIVALMYGFSILPETFGWILILIGTVIMTGFVFWENRNKSPLIKIDLFRNNRVFIFSNISALISYAATYAIIFMMSLYLQYIKVLGPETAGLILAVQPAIMALASPLTGRLSDKVEPRILGSLGMGITCICLAILSFLSSSTSIMTIIITLAFIGIGFAMFVPPNTNAVMSSVDPKVYGVASAIVNTMRNFGQMFSMGVTMMVLALVMGSVVITETNSPQFITSTRIAFTIFSILCLIGVFTSFARGNIIKKKVVH